MNDCYSDCVKSFGLSCRPSNVIINITVAVIGIGSSVNVSNSSSAGDIGDNGGSDGGGSEVIVGMVVVVSHRCC
jgi:hypothetical protein